MLDRTAIARDEAINEALYDAIWFGDGEGTPSATVFAHRLRKHGLVIVEASEHDRMRTTLQLIGSCVTEINGIPTALEAMAQAARNALAKGA